MDSSKQIFKNKTIEDLYKEIYDNSVNTKKQIKELIGGVKKQLEEEGSLAATVNLSPVLVEYLEVGVKADDHLLKLANIIQRGETKEADPFGIGDIQALLDEQQDLIQKVDSK